MFAGTSHFIKRNMKIIFFIIYIYIYIYIYIFKARYKISATTVHFPFFFKPASQIHSPLTNKKFKLGVVCPNGILRDDEYLDM